MAWAVAVLSTLVGLGYVAQAVASLLLQDPLIRAVETADVARVNELDLLLALVGLLALLPWIPAFVVTGIWLLQLRRFAERVNPHFQHGRRRWWAFGGWVVPIVSLWFPLQYTGNLRDALRPNHHGGSLFGWWWAVFLVSIITENALTPSGESVDDLSWLGTGAAIRAGLALVALGLWLAVVRRLATAVDEVPEEVVRRTAFAADPSPYAAGGVAPGAPIYGPPHG